MSAAPTLRLLRCVLGVAEAGSAARAGGRLHLSVSAVTRAVQQAEAELGLPLFERGARGMVGTPAGQLLVARAARAFAELQRGLGTASAPRVSDAMLAALLAVAETGSEGAAAQRLGVSQPAVHGALRQLEHGARKPLFERTRRGTRLTDAGQTLLRHARLALAELRIGQDELAAFRGLAPGRVALGALPMAGDVLVPQALSRLFADEPALQVTVVDGTYEALLQQLRHGDIDCIVGPLRGAAAVADVAEQLLFEEALRPVMRAGHPALAAARPPRSLKALLRWPWVGPLPGTPARAAFERAFAAAGLAVPPVVLQANSPAVVRSVLMAGNAVAMLSPLQIHAELASGLLALPAVPVRGSERAVGVTLRRDGMPSPACLRLLAALQAVADTVTGR